MLGAGEKKGAKPEPKHKAKTTTEEEIAGLKQELWGMKERYEYSFNTGQFMDEARPWTQADIDVGKGGFGPGTYAAGMRQKIGDPMYVGADGPAGFGQFGAAPYGQGEKVEYWQVAPQQGGGGTGAVWEPHRGKPEAWDSNDKRSAGLILATFISKDLPKGPPVLRGSIEINRKYIQTACGLTVPPLPAQNLLTKTRQIYVVFR